MTNHMKKVHSTVAVAVGALLLAGLGLFWSSSARAQGGCSNGTLRGNYAFVIDGQILSGPTPGILRGLAMTHFDGDGNLAQVDVITINGSQQGSDWSPGTGTYEVSPDCTGEATINTEHGPPLDLRLVTADHGTTVHTIVVGNPVSSTGTKVN
jgi:hypothetical protein